MRAVHSPTWSQNRRLALQKEKVCLAVSSESLPQRGQCLPGPLWSSSQEELRVPCKPPGEPELGVVQEAQTCCSIAMRADLLPRQAVPLSQLLVPDIVFYEAVNGHWTKKVDGGPFGICGQTVLCPSAYDELRPLGLTWGEERIGRSKPVFQRACGSPDQAYLDPHYAYIECRYVCRTSACDLPIAIWWENIVALTDELQADEVQTMGKGSRGRCTRHTPPPWPLRTTSFETRYPLLSPPEPRKPSLSCFRLIFPFKQRSAQSRSDR